MNTLKTTVLMALLMGIMVAAGGSFGGREGATIMFVIALGMNFFSYWFSDSMVLSAYSAREVGPSEAPELYQMVEQLSKNAGIPMPKVCIIPSDVPNAFATGRSPSHAAVAVTTGILRVLNMNELAGVLAHELSHVKHRDTLISTVAATFATVISWIANVAQFASLFGGRSNDDERGGGLGTLVTILIAPFAAMLIQMAISRSREYEADKSGGEICGNPLALASALEKLEYASTRMRPLAGASTSNAHLCIVNPLSNAHATFAGLFSTHPPMQDRIARLREQAREMRSGR